MAGARTEAGPLGENLRTSRKIMRAEIITDRADVIRRANAFSPNVRMETAFAQYPKTGFSKYFNPFRRGTTQSPEVSISLGISPYRASSGMVSGRKPRGRI